MHVFAKTCSRWEVAVSELVIDGVLRVDLEDAPEEAERPRGFFEDLKRQDETFVAYVADLTGDIL
jgi:hypothetical protein